MTVNKKILYKISLLAAIIFISSATMTPRQEEPKVSKQEAEDVTQGHFAS